MTLWKWSRTASDNDDADSTINWAEGQAPSTVNNSARAEMAAVAKYRDDVSGAVASGGGTTAYTFSTYQGLTELTDGFKIAFTCNATNTGASTLNVDSLGAVALQKVKGTAMEAGELVAGCVYTATYDSASTAAWVIHGGVDNVRTPPGIVVPYAGTSAPAGWLLCYGQAISRTTYAALFAAISTTYGAGDTSTTFNLPDLRGRVVAGQDDMGGTSADRLTDQSGGLDGDTLGDTGGSETHTLTEAQLAAHTHGAGTFVAASHRHGISGAQDVDTAGNDNARIGGDGTDVMSGFSGTLAVSGTSGSTGTDAAHNNVQPTIILNYIIKY